MSPKNEGYMGIVEKLKDFFIQKFVWPAGACPMSNVLEAAMQHTQHNVEIFFSMFAN